MGHVGLTPQSATMLGGFKTQGRTAEAAQQIVEGAKALEDAGCCSSRPRGGAGTGRRARSRRSCRSRRSGSAPARAATARCSSTTTCSGMSEGHLPRFVKRYANLSGEIRDALVAYAAEVRSGAFPEEQHTYAMSEEERAAFEAGMQMTVAEHEERRQRRREPRRRDAPAPAPAVHAAHADDEQQRAPGERRVEEPAEDPVARPPVAAAGAEELLAVDRDPERPERERASRRAERTRGRARAAPAGSCRARRTGARAEEQSLLRQPVRRERVDGAAEERPAPGSATPTCCVVEERRATGLPSTPAKPASADRARSSGSCRASTASSESSRSETKTARGATSTAGRAQPPAPVERRRACLRPSPRSPMPRYAAPPPRDGQRRAGGSRP